MKWIVNKLNNGYGCRNFLLFPCLFYITPHETPFHKQAFNVDHLNEMVTKQTEKKILPGFGTLNFVMTT